MPAVTNARDLIKRHEGLRLIPYFDSCGYRTVGYGHRLYADHLKSPISPDLAEQLFEDDFERAAAGVRRIFMAEDASPRTAALQDMCFQLGEAALRKFTHMVWAINNRADWEDAALEALRSKYASQVPARANDIANLLRTNDWASITQGADHG